MKVLQRFSKRDSDISPEEVRDYYKSKPKQRLAVAWILGVGTLIATLVVATAVFYGGRFLYRKIAGTDKPAVTPGVIQTADNQNSKTTEKSSNQKKKKPAPVQATRTSLPSNGDQELPHTGDH